MCGFVSIRWRKSLHPVLCAHPMQVGKPYFDAPGTIEAPLGPTAELSLDLPPVTIVRACACTGVCL